MVLPDEELDNIICLALAEDIGHGDVTSEALIPTELQGKAYILIKAEGVLAGGEIASRILLNVDPLLNVEILIKDGTRVRPGDIIATVSGSVVSILRAERVVLNFLQRLSGIATQTARYIVETGDFNVTITDTRKTTPGLRLLEKYAVRMGGGKNHRFNLGDGILIKDNHLVALRALGMSLRDIVARVKQNAPDGLKVEVEVSNTQEAIDAVEAGADIIMLDNMSPGEMRRIVDLVSGIIKIEASGGITLESIGSAAMTGVLTHSPEALDMSLELEPQTLKLL
jgi:nicotinate-nucleotide pyrophosphorylase (carboxylating)